MDGTPIKREKKPKAIVGSEDFKGLNAGDRIYIASKDSIEAYVRPFVIVRKEGDSEKLVRGHITIRPGVFGFIERRYFTGMDSEDELARPNLAREVTNEEKKYDRYERIWNYKPRFTVLGWRKINPERFKIKQNDEEN